MPAIGRPVVSPYNPSNFVIPNRLSIWFAPFDSAGRQTEFFELGEVSGIEVDLSETFLDKKSARQGVQNTVKRLISDQAGAINFTMGEVVGRNLELLFRPSDVTVRDGVANAEAVVYEQTRPRLVGTTAAEIAPGIARECGPCGTLFNRELTILSVTNPEGNVVYADTTDYVFTQAVEGVASKQTLSLVSFTAAASDTFVLTNSDGTTLTLTVGTEIATGASIGELRDNLVKAINAYSSEYYAEASGAADIELAHCALDGSTAADVTATGGLDTDLGGSGTYSFAAGTATTPATIERVASGAIPDGAEVVVKFSYNRRGIEYRLQSGLILEGALRVQALSTSGPQAFYEFPRVSLEINGTINLSPEEYYDAAITATILPAGDGVRGRYTQLCCFSDFFIESAATACPAAPIA